MLSTAGYDNFIKMMTLSLSGSGHVWPAPGL